MLRLVLDSNVVLAALGRASPTRWAFDALLGRRFAAVASTAILLEYEEAIGARTSPEVGKNVADLIGGLKTTVRAEPHFRWRLIPADPDDDVFVDAALAAGADAIVTEDAHFGALDGVRFPPIAVWGVARLRAELDARPAA